LQQASDLENLEANLSARLSVAEAAASAVEAINENERSQFLVACAYQRQQLLDFISWEFRQVWKSFSVSFVYQSLWFVLNQTSLICLHF
jgi:hypothetical protein